VSRTRLATAATLIFVALNLRMAIAAVPPVLTQIQDDTGLGSAGSGVLTALPLICFGTMAAGAPALVRRLRMGSLLGMTMGIVALGCAVRLLPSLAALFVGTAIVGSGIAVANVILPGLIKRDFRDVAAPMIALYALALSLGATIPAGLTIPFEDLTGAGWRPAVAIWGVVAVAALVLWLPRARRAEPAVAVTPRPSAARAMRRDRVAWAVTLFMGLQSLCYYAMLSWLPAILESHGMSSGKAGWMLSYMTIPGMAASLFTPAVQRRLPRSELEVLLAALLLATGYVGLIVAGASAAYVWVTAIGLAGGLLIALALSYIVARADDDHHVAHLSTMAQGVGYLIAASGPFIFGALHGLTESWTVPLLVLLVVLVPMLLAGITAGREGQVLAGTDLAPAEDLGAEPAADWLN
jgi:CP family cyanate transporter-like MFS transporter